MKKTSESLDKAQEKALVYREKLESGEIRLIPEKAPRTKERSGEAERAQVQP